MIKVMQIGLGPLGQKIGKYISERSGISTVAAVDKNPDLIGQTFEGVIIKGSLEEALHDAKPDVAILSTVSSLKGIAPQIQDLAHREIPIVSTCEELSYPWDTDPHLATQLDDLAKQHNIAVVGTGVNPGFLMDSLPTFLTAVCQDVQFVEVNRFQDAQYRRIPFQNKIGAGLSLHEFEVKKASGTLRHVGLTESMQFIANRMGWKLDRTEDIIEPVVATQDVETSRMVFRKGNALGVMQTGKAYVGEELKILLQFKAAIGIPESFDEIRIKGQPDISSKIMGGVNGDIATCAIVLNTIPPLLQSTPGLKTMGDIPLASYFS